MKEVLLIKLGGSLITDKSKPYTARKRVISRLAGEIKDAIFRNSKLNVILGNGSGSFGHTSAAKYGTANGYNSEEGKRGFCLVQDDAAKINRICVEQFLKCGLNVIGVSPNNVMITEEKKLSKVNLFQIEEMVYKKIIPFVYGDCLLDTKIGSCIYSCDQVMGVISRKIDRSKFKITKIISVGDFAGVLDENGQVVTLIDGKVYEGLLKKGAIKGSDKTDVTGGMKAKLDTLMKEVEGGAESLIIDGRVKGNLTRAILGKGFEGTKVVR